MPGYLLRPDNSGAARPTFVVTNGSDSSLPSMLVHGAAEALARGWNAFLFDGPGQQSMLFERNVPFRYDWEAVLTPVIDALVERPEVDPSALTGYGVSQGGYWITRAVAFEHRLVAAVADPGAVDMSEGWTQHLAPPVLECSSRAKRTPSTRPWPRPALTRPWPGPLLSGASPTASATASTCSPRSRSTRCATSPGRSLPRC